jgi:hypothetical protein
MTLEEELDAIEQSIRNTEGRLGEIKERKCKVEEGSE